MVDFHSAEAFTLPRSWDESTHCLGVIIGAVVLSLVTYYVCSTRCLWQTGGPQHASVAVGITDSMSPAIREHSKAGQTQSGLRQPKRPQQIYACDQCDKVFASRFVLNRLKNSPCLVEKPTALAARSVVGPKGLPVLITNASICLRSIPL